MVSSVINRSKYYISINSMDFQEHIFNIAIIWKQSVLYFTKVSTLCYLASERVTTLTTTKLSKSCVSYRGHRLYYEKWQHRVSLRKTPGKLSKFREGVMQVFIRPVFRIIYTEENSNSMLDNSNIPNMKIPRVFPRYEVPVTTKMSNLLVIWPCKLLGSITLFKASTTELTI